MGSADGRDADVKPSEIEVGETYVNRGAGKTMRRVIAIGADCVPDEWHGFHPPPVEPGVLFVQKGKTQKIYLSSFASWAGAKVAETHFSPLEHEQTK